MNAGRGSNIKYLAYAFTENGIVITCTAAGIRPISFTADTAKCDILTALNLSAKDGFGDCSEIDEMDFV